MLLGVDESGFTNHEQLKEYLEKRNIDNNYAATFDTAFLGSMLKEKYCLDTMKRKDFCPLQIRFYNKTGQILGGWETCLGTLNYHQGFDTFPFVSKKIFPLNKKVNLTNDLDFLILDNRKNLIDEIPKHNYVMIVFWGKNMGVLSKNVLNQTKKYLQKHRDRDIILVTCNMDGL